jgi:hypothetical protein
VKGISVDNCDETTTMEKPKPENDVLLLSPLQQQQPQKIVVAGDGGGREWDEMETV